MLKRLPALILAMILGAPVTAAAFPIAPAGTEGFFVIVGSTADVIAKYEGNSAAFSNDLYLATGGFGFVFNNHTTPVGTQVNLGSYAVGTELLFRLHVNNTGNDFFTGPAARNPDGHTHARVQSNFMLGTTLVSFEDLFNGPFVYNDLSFSFTNTSGSETPEITPAPEPTTLAILGFGLAGLAVIRRRKTA